MKKYGPNRWIPREGDLVKGHFGIATVCAVFPETDDLDRHIVQLAYPGKDKMSTTERTVGLYQTAYGLRSNEPYWTNPIIPLCDSRYTPYDHYVDTGHNDFETWKENDETITHCLTCGGLWFD